ncbi:MAG: Glu/Leu/Phe/Val dehydrogenase dimerization domain-containing protein [Hyphomicrobium sp.]
MAVFSAKSFANHDEVVFWHDARAGLKAIIAIHDTTLGPALGGCRMWNYASDDEALEDVLRLSRGMTYKAAMAGLNLGGGKSVILGDPHKDKSESLLRSLGRFVDNLAGRYIVAEDVGMSVADMDIVRQETRHVAGVGERGGDPSPATAWGVYNGIKAAVHHKLDREELTGVSVAVQGVGHVGTHLCDYLARDGVRLVVTDIDEGAIGLARERYGAAAVAPDEIYDAEVEVFAPCALGGVINDQTIPRLKASIVAGSANNQLAEARHGKALVDRGILYAPDYVINAGGLIYVSYEVSYRGPYFDRDVAMAHAGRLYNRLRDLFARAEAERVPTHEMADRIAWERLEEVRAARSKRE